MNKHDPQAMIDSAVAKGHVMLMTKENAIAALAECYRAAGADPDGMEDWRLAQHAVEAVKALRRDYDAETAPVVEALEGLVTAVSLRNWQERGAAKVREALVTARAAIAKARGES